MSFKPISRSSSLCAACGLLASVPALTQAIELASLVVQPESGSVLQPSAAHSRQRVEQVPGGINVVDYALDEQAIIFLLVPGVGG